MKIYISGPISDNPNYKEDFAEAEKELRELGHVVLNPIKDEGFSYKDCIDMCLAELSKCDAIYMLNGWEDSKGARLEYVYAITVGLEYFLEK